MNLSRDLQPMTGHRLDERAGFAPIEAAGRFVCKQDSLGARLFRPWQARARDCANRTSSRGLPRETLVETPNAPRRNSELKKPRLYNGASGRTEARFSLASVFDRPYCGQVSSCNKLRVSR